VLEMTRPIEFMKPFATGVVIYQPGHVMPEPMSAAWAEVLVQRGIAKYYDPMPHGKQAMRLQQPRATRRGRKRKRV
jgi:hypothetical protein